MLCMSTSAPRQCISLQAGPAPVLGPYSAIGRFWLTCGAPTALAAGSAVSYCTRNTTLRPCCPKCPRTASTGRAGGRTSASASACASAAAVCWETLPAIPACIRRTSVKRSRSASPRKRLGRVVEGREQDHGTEPHRQARPRTGHRVCAGSVVLFRRRAALPRPSMHDKRPGRGGGLLGWIFFNLTIFWRYVVNRN